MFNLMYNIYVQYFVFNSFKISDEKFYEKLHRFRQDLSFLDIIGRRVALFI